MRSGILLIDKPPGVTSFEVVRRARRVLKVRKIGHLGTLDPFATGLLPLCLVEATKLTPFLLPEPKTYWARMKLGEETTTQDLTGQVTVRRDHLPDPEAVRLAAARFLGEIDQVPPMYSALHHEGERLYQLARRGVVVARRPRKVTVHRLEVEEVDLPLVTVTVQCSQGTYIRTLAADIGAALGCGGHLTALRRLAVGPFRVADALPLADMERMAPEELRNRIIPLAECLPGMRPVEVGAVAARQLRQGRGLPWRANGVAPGERVRVLAEKELVAVARVRQGDPHLLLAPERVFKMDQQPAAGL